MCDALNSYPVGLGVAAFRPTAKKTFTIKTATDLYTLDHAIVKSNSDLAPNTLVDDVDDFLLGHVPTSPKNHMVELTGIEPVASWLQTRRSPS
jgi:hypothetical protein